MNPTTSKNGEKATVSGGAAFGFIRAPDTPLSLSLSLIPFSFSSGSHMTTFFFFFLFFCLLLHFSCYYWFHFHFFFLFFLLHQCHFIWFSIWKLKITLQSPPDATSLLPPILNFQFSPSAFTIQFKFSYVILIKL